MRRGQRFQATLVALSVTVASCGGGGGGPTGSTSTNNNPPPPAGTPNSIVVRNNEFNPTDLTTTKNSTVVFTWDTCTGGDYYGVGQTCVTHDVVFDDSQTSGPQSSGTYSRTFTAAGTFPYHCSIHGSAMSGKVIVQ